VTSTHLNRLHTLLHAVFFSLKNVVVYMQQKFDQLFADLRKA